MSRRRKKPLFPEPFEDVLIGSRMHWTHTKPLAKEYGRFCPEQDMERYRTQLSEEKKTELDCRTNRLAKRAIQNQHFMASEFNWEADAWHDVFGLIRDDDTFRMLFPFHLTIPYQS
jgi:hypothetical protein